MSTWAPGHLPTRSVKGTPEMFFIATAIKACYRKLPKLDQYEDGTAEDLGRIDGCREPPVKRVRLQQTGDRVVDTEESSLNYSIDVEYKRLYCELRNKALAEIKTLVREYVERLSTASVSYDFMNIYGLCSFNPPDVAKQQQRELPMCKFTRSQGGLGDRDELIVVCGIMNPLMSARLEHGILELTPCGETDCYRTAEEYAKLYPRSRMRLPRASNAKVGSTLSSLEHQFIFTVRRDLHTLGLAYNHIMCIVELLYLNILQFIHS